MYLNPRVHGSIPTKDKNYTRKGGEEDHVVAVLGPPNMVGPGLLLTGVRTPVIVSNLTVSTFLSIEIIYCYYACIYLLFLVGLGITMTKISIPEDICK
jgi:hypothetical protein